MTKVNMNVRFSTLLVSVCAKDWHRCVKGFRVLRVFRKPVGGDLSSR